MAASPSRAVPAQPGAKKHRSLAQRRSENATFWLCKPGVSERVRDVRCLAIPPSRPARAASLPPCSRLFTCRQRVTPGWHRASLVGLAARMVRRPLKTETAANHSTGKAPQPSRSARWASCLLVCGLPLVVLAAMYGCFAAVVAAAIESSKSAAHAAFASSAAAAGAELRSSWAQLVATLDSAARAVEVRSCSLG